jgi:hypothetical protein
LEKSLNLEKFEKGFKFQKFEKEFEKKENSLNPSSLPLFPFWPS